jgi:hypothetical protein
MSFDTQLSANLEDEPVGDWNRLESVLYPKGCGHRAIRLPPIMEREAVRDCCRFESGRTSKRGVVQVRPRSNLGRRLILTHLW